MSDRLRRAFKGQGRACALLGSAFMARLMPLIGARLTDATAVGARCLAWEGDVSAAGQSVPLRLAGALHALVLDGTAPDLASVYPPNVASDDALWQTIEGALRRYEPRILQWLDRAPQTNEVRRAAAVIAGIWWVLDRTGPRPITLSELGASAGLNLAMDRFALSAGGRWHGPPDSPVRLAPDWRGTLPPPPQPLTIADRRGVDLAPLDPAEPGDQLRLLAYLWPDQPDRMARTRAALQLAGPAPDCGDAAPWLATRLAAGWDGLQIVYSTIAAQYFPPETQTAIDRTLASYGARATLERPLAHISLEVDGRRPGAALSATLWRGDAPLHAKLGRADFHLAWIDFTQRPFQKAGVSRMHPANDL